MRMISSVLLCFGVRIIFGHIPTLDKFWTKSLGHRMYSGRFLSEIGTITYCSLRNRPVSSNSPLVADRFFILSREVILNCKKTLKVAKRPLKWFRSMQAKRECSTTESANSCSNLSPMQASCIL